MPPKQRYGAKNVARRSARQDVCQPAPARRNRPFYVSLATVLLTTLAATELGAATDGKFYDLSKVGRLSVPADGKVFDISIDKYWRENNNAHSYSIIIMHHATKGAAHEIVTIQDSPNMDTDFVADAPGADCFSRKAVMHVSDREANLILLRNEFATPSITQVIRAKLEYSGDAIPGFSELRFSFSGSQNVKRLCTVEDFLRINKN